MNELITLIVKSLVDHEDKIEVKEVTGSFTTIFEVSVDKEDVGKLIGKQGNTAKAIRTILKAVSKKDNKKYVLNIL